MWSKEALHRWKDAVKASNGGGTWVAGPPRCSEENVVEERAASSMSGTRNLTVWNEQRCGQTRYRIAEEAPERRLVREALGWLGQKPSRCQSKIWSKTAPHRSRNAEDACTEEIEFKVGAWVAGP